MKIFSHIPTARISFGVLMLIAAFWLSCTQQNPMDPTSSVGGDVVLITEMSVDSPQISLGGAQAVISVRLLNDKGTALRNRQVSFSTTLGTITTRSTTNNDGRATATLVSGTEAGTATVSVQCEQSIKSIKVKFVTTAESLLKIETGKTVLLADGVSQTDITVTVLSDTGTGEPGAVVMLSASSGQIPNGVITGENGQSIAQYTSIASLNDTTVTITATYDTLSVGTTLRLKGVTLSVDASPDAILPDGASFSTITALVKETTSNVPIPDAEVTFGTTMGTITGKAFTNNQGVATAQLVSSQQSGTATVTAYYGNQISESLEVVFMEATASSYRFQEIVKSTSEILANGIDEAEIRVKVIDSDGNVVQGDSIRFVPSCGFVGNEWGVTDASGWTSTQLTAYASEEDSTCILTVLRKDGSPSVPVTIKFIGVTLSLSASPESIVADGQSQSEIRAHLVRTSNNVPVASAVIEFGTTAGTIVGEAKTNNSGVAIVDLTSSRDQGTAVVTASYGIGTPKTTQVEFTESVPTHINLTVSPTILPADGVSQAQINAIVTDASSNPVPDGTVVQFQKVSGGGRLEGQKTTVNGVASSTITSATQPGTARIIAQVNNLISEDTVSVTFTLGEASNVTLSSSQSEIPADGVTKSIIQAALTDANGNPIEGSVVSFEATIGDVVASARTDAQGIAEVDFSSTLIGVSTITATVQVGNANIYGSTTINIIPGAPDHITLTYDPNFIYVRNAGKNQTLSIYADVRDEKNNPVADSTLVRFSIFASPGTSPAGNGDQLSTTNQVPTVNGKCQVTYKSGTRSGSVRIQADVYDNNNNIVATGISTEFVVFAGPPYIADRDDSTTSHLTIVANRLNIWSGVDTTEITVLVGDKYHNPVQEGTAVYLTASGGVVTTTAYTDENGIAKARLYSGNPMPDIYSFYYGEGMQNPNNGNLLGHPLNEPLLPNYEDLNNFNMGYVENSNNNGDRYENDGIARIMAHTEGVDESGASAKVWGWNMVVYSKHIPSSRTSANQNGWCFSATNSADSLDPGEFAIIRFQLWDENGNPVVAGSKITASFAPAASKAELSWTEVETGDPGTTEFDLRLYNVINPNKEEDRPGNVNVVIKVESVNGHALLTTDSIYLNKPEVAP